DARGDQPGRAHGPATSDAPGDAGLVDRGVDPRGGAQLAQAAAQVELVHRLLPGWWVVRGTLSVVASAATGPSRSSSRRTALDRYRLTVPWASPMRSAISGTVRSS